jgi:nicotinamidase/pyrazinamidase
VKEIVFVDIDTQYDFIMPRGKLYVKHAEQIIPNLKYLTRIAENNDILIISSVDTHIKNDPEFKQFPGHCIKGSPGQRKIPETLLKEHVFIPQKILNRGQLFNKIKGRKQIIIEKNTYDAFVNFNLLGLLRPFQAAFVYGLALDYCLKYAVSGLLQAGLEVNLIIDAAKPVYPEAEKPLLSSFRNNGVRLIKTKEIQAEIRRPLNE